MADTPKHSVSVAGIVVDDQDRVLVIQRRDNGHWEPPGGVLELEETPEEGVVREVFEETGIKAHVIAISGVYKNLKAGVVSLVFCAKSIGGELCTSSESRKTRWMTLDEINDNMLPAYAVRITDAFDERVRVRTHDGVDLL